MLKVSVASKKISVISCGEEWIHHFPLAVLHVHDIYHQRTDKVTFYTEDCEIKKTDSGYNFLLCSEETGIKLQTRFRIKDRHLWVDIPYSSVIETKKYQWLLEGVEILPCFGAQPHGADGYLIWPNYSGVSCKFDKTELKEFRDIIYGADNRWENFTSMPLFGLITNSKGFLCIVSQGQFECELIHRLAVGPQKLHSTTPLLRFRMDPRQNIEETDRVIRYSFFEGDENNFVEMAKAYRQYLLVYRNLSPLKDRTVNNPSLDYATQSQWLKIFCADKEIKIDGNGEYRIWSSFEQAKEILSEFKSRRIDKITCMLVGWNQEGHDGRYPDRLPPDEHLGGLKQMKALTEWGKQEGLQIVVHDNYVDRSEKAQAFDEGEIIESEIMRDERGYMRCIGLWSGGRSFRMRSESALKYAKRDIPVLKNEIGLDGMYYIDAISLGLEPDFTPGKVLPRSDFARGQLAIVNEAKAFFGSCQTENNLDYIFDVSDSCASVVTHPYRIKTFNTDICANMNELLPFFNIAWHGIVVYHHTDLFQYKTMTGENPFKAVLQEISWGALGRIELTYKNSFEAKGFACIEDSEFLDAVAVQYDLLNRKAGYLQKEFIEDYRQLDENVIETKFSDGSVVTVDYAKVSCKIKNASGAVIVDKEFEHI